ncbi:MAG: DUF3048 domain-containing protein [Actinomycetota bacterium]|nr:DUF3048 domain-containing protein [Actinomycetota bacterium]
MSGKKRTAAIGGGVVVLALVAFFLTGDRSAGNSGFPSIPGFSQPPVCPLSGSIPKGSIADRPAVVVKVENNPVAWPLSGLEDAEVVYEELVEGGITRFMAIYHCTDASKVGPIRSAREVDPAIMSPITKILAGAGANSIVQKALDKADIVVVDEESAGSAMERVERPGITSEHTLYGDTVALRKVGARKFDTPPPQGLFSFGDLQDGATKATHLEIDFSGATKVEYNWVDGKWARSEDQAVFEDETGDQIAVDNILIEEHKVNESDKIVDVAGNPSIEIEDVTGSGRAVLFRDGQALVGRWERKELADSVDFLTKAGDAMVLKEGTTWIELVPSDEGQIKGSFSFTK